MFEKNDPNTILYYYVKRKDNLILVSITLVELILYMFALKIEQTENRNRPFTLQELERDWAGWFIMINALCSTNLINLNAPAIWYENLSLAKLIDETFTMNNYPRSFFNQDSPFAQNNQPMMFEDVSRLTNRAKEDRNILTVLCNTFLSNIDQDTKRRIIEEQIKEMKKTRWKLFCSLLTTCIIKLSCCIIRTLQLFGIVFAILVLSSVFIEHSKQLSLSTT